MNQIIQEKDSKELSQLQSIQKNQQINQNQNNINEKVQETTSQKQMSDLLNRLGQKQVSVKQFVQFVNNDLFGQKYKQFYQLRHWSWYDIKRKVSEVQKQYLKKYFQKCLIQIYNLLDFYSNSRIKQQIKIETQQQRELIVLKRFFKRETQTFFENTAFFQRYKQLVNIGQKQKTKPKQLIRLAQQNKKNQNLNKESFKQTNQKKNFCPIKNNCTSQDIYRNMKDNQNYQRQNNCSSLKHNSSQNNTNLSQKYSKPAQQNITKNKKITIQKNGYFIPFQKIFSNLCSSLFNSSENKQKINGMKKLQDQTQQENLLLQQNSEHKHNQ